MIHNSIINTFYSSVRFSSKDAEGKGCFTMSDLYNFRGEWGSGKSKGPVYVLDDDNKVNYYPDKFTGKWLLTSELYVTGGGTKSDCWIVGCVLRTRRAAAGYHASPANCQHVGCLKT